MNSPGLWLAACLLLASAGCQSGAPAVPPATAPPLAQGDMARNPEQARRSTARAQSLIDKGRYSEAQPLLQQAIDADSGYAPAHNNLGLVYFQLGQYYQAAWEFQTASRLQPDKPQPLNNLGLVLEAGEKLTEAEQAYTRAAKLDTQNIEYSANLARVRVRLGLLDEETHKLLDMIILKDPRPQWVEWARSNIYRMHYTPDATPTP